LCGTVDVYIDGGETYYYGNIIDALTGEMITNGTVETPVEMSVLSFDETLNQSKTTFNSFLNQHISLQ